VKKMKPVRFWKFAYALTLLALFAHALYEYPPAAAHFADMWSGGARLSPFDSRLHKPAVVYAIEKSGSELKVRVLRTYVQPAIQDMAVRLTVFNSDGSASVYVFKQRAPPGYLIEYTVHAPLAVSLRVEIEVNGAREVEERWLGGS
jgi:hypothetical protein